MRLSSTIDVEDFVAGTNLLSGGGGAPNEALEQLLETFDEGVEIRWIDVDELDDDDLVVTACYSGSVDPESWRTRRHHETEHGLERLHPRPLIHAVARLEPLVGQEVAAIIAVEIGASNTAAALDAGVRTSRAVVDGDYAGRAIPSLLCITPAIYDKVRPPVVLADYYGDVVSITEWASLEMVEVLGKMAAKASFGKIGFAGIPLRARDVKQLAVRGTLTRSLAAGRALRTAAGHADPVAALCELMPEIRILFQGTLRATEWDNAAGYMTGQHRLDGAGEWLRRALRIFFQNENHIAWLDEEPIAMSPDVIEIVDLHTAAPLVNTLLEVGQEVAVLAWPRRPEFDTPEGIAALGPARWGFSGLPFKGLEAA